MWDTASSSLASARPPCKETSLLLRGNQPGGFQNCAFAIFSFFVPIFPPPPSCLSLSPPLLGSVIGSVMMAMKHVHSPQDMVFADMGTLSIDSSSSSLAGGGRVLGKDRPLGDTFPLFEVHREKAGDVASEDSSFIAIDETIASGMEDPSSKKRIGEGTQPKLYARGHWRPAEDAKLRVLVSLHGPQNWNLIAEKLEGRSGTAGCYFLSPYATMPIRTQYNHDPCLILFFEKGRAAGCGGSTSSTLG